MFLGDDQACVARVVHLNETRGSKLVISGSLWIFFFFKSEAEPQKKNLIRKFSYDKDKNPS